MSKVLLPLYYLPSVSWFVHFFSSPEVVIESCESFVKSTARNRCCIAGAGGKLMLSIPVEGGRDHHQLYRKTKISHHENWQKKHWHSIASAYSSTPFYEYYVQTLEPFYSNKHESLFDFNLQLLNVLLQLLKCDKQFELTTDFQRQPEQVTDLRYSIITNKALPRYYQIFEDRNGFIADLSIVDLLFHLGPDAKSYLLNTIQKCS
ncbi:MAG: WbqC family protein [Chitinophagales bacterium]|nr:WbqC family protein [Chitinophagales bacterium]